jgi:hypothetical protein
MEMLVGEQKQDGVALLLDPAGRRSLISPFRINRKCRMCVRAGAGALGQLRVPGERVWAKAGAAGICWVAGVEQTTAWRCICTLWKARRRSPRVQLSLPLADEASRRRQVVDCWLSSKPGARWPAGTTTGFAG